MRFEDMMLYMPDKRLHRGCGPQDQMLFGAAQLPVLRSAAADFCLLLSKGYAEKSSLKLVGDRYSLTSRQRAALVRCCCTDQQLKLRTAKQRPVNEVSGSLVLLDGYNLLITLEGALGQAALFRGRDGCIRDIAGLHGTYRKVQETIPALELVCEVLEELMPAEVLWLLDSPVSNSGRLKGLIERVGKEKGRNWRVRLETNPDCVLAGAEGLVVSSDSAILDQCAKWVNLADFIIRKMQARGEGVLLLDFFSEAL